jgi:pre-mRNA cleavage complex 2 protein Pcf11
MQTAPLPTQEITRVDQLPSLKLSTLDVNKYVLYYHAYISITNISRPLPGAVNILYGAIGLQCRQCGLRFPKTDLGKSEMEEHMDWHFRANRRAKDTTKRMVSREWYLDVGEWIAENEESEQAGKSCAPFFGE